MAQNDTRGVGAKGSPFENALSFFRLSSSEPFHFRILSRTRYYFSSPPFGNWAIHLSLVRTARAMQSFLITQCWSAEYRICLFAVSKVTNICRTTPAREFLFYCKYENSFQSHSLCHFFPHSSSPAMLGHFGIITIFERENECVPS